LSGPDDPLRSSQCESLTTRPKIKNKNQAGRDSAGCKQKEIMNMTTENIDTGTSNKPADSPMLPNMNAARKQREEAVRNIVVGGLGAWAVLSLPRPRTMLPRTPAAANTLSPGARFSLEAFNF
jgi:hypothetical protein